MMKAIRLTESILHKIIKESINAIIMESIYDTPNDINGRPINVGDIVLVKGVGQYEQFRGLVKKIKMEDAWYEYSTEPIFLITLDLLRRRTNEVYGNITITSKDYIEVKGNERDLKNQKNNGNLRKK